MCIFASTKIGNRTVFISTNRIPTANRPWRKPLSVPSKKSVRLIQSEIIEDRPAKNGIIRPNLDPHTRPQWAEAFYLIMHKSRLGCTLEAPSDFPLSTRVNALVAGVDAALAT